MINSYCYNFKLIKNNEGLFDNCLLNILEKYYFKLFIKNNLKFHKKYYFNNNYIKLSL
jgi:hypothetical protein